MKIEINLPDFYFDEDDLGKSISDVLTNQIKHRVISEINQKIQDKVKEEISLTVHKLILDTFKETIKTRIDEFIKTEAYIERYGKKMTLEESIISVFSENRSFNQDTQYAISKVAETHAAKLKTQYDHFFANEIIKGIGKMGLLKDDFAAILLEAQKK